jgi:hypothetical protein
MSGGDGIAAYKVKFTINLKRMTIRRELFEIPNMDIAKIREGKLEE